MKRIALLTSLAFALVATFGLGLNAMQHNSGMPECPTMQNQSAMCPLNAQERLEKWQELANINLPSANIMIWAVILLIVMLTPSLPLGIKRDPGLFAHVPLGPPLFARIQNSKLKNHIQEALRSGILNPQID